MKATDMFDTEGRRSTEQPRHVAFHVKDASSGRATAAPRDTIPSRAMRVMERGAEALPAMQTEATTTMPTALKATATMTTNEKGCETCQGRLL